MTDQTPEEMAEKFLDRLGDLFFSYSVRPTKFKKAFADKIRAAVAAETKRCRRRVLEQRREKGTYRDRALLAAVKAIDTSTPAPNEVAE